METRLEQYLLRMRIASLNALRYAEGMSFAEFLVDEKTQQAIAMNLFNLGETATKVTERFSAFAEVHPEIPWRSIRGLRNRIAHDYFDLDLQVIWKTVDLDLRVLAEGLRAILESER